MNKWSGPSAYIFKILQPTYRQRPQTTHVKSGNRFTTKLKKFTKVLIYDYYLVPPYYRRQISADCLIGIFKDHFISGLSS